MAKIVVTWTPSALRYLDEIHYYITIESGSTTPADNFIEKIFKRTSQLSKFPDSGQIEKFLSERGLQCRYLVEGNYKIVYEYIAEKKIVVVVDVFHTRQNPNNILNR